MYSSLHSVVSGGILWFDGLAGRPGGEDHGNGIIILKLWIRTGYRFVQKAHTACLTRDLLCLRYGGGLKGCMTRGGDSAR
jgi:hypothetical protein